MDDPDIKRVIEHWPFKVVERDNNPVIIIRYHGEDHDFSPEEVIAMVLTELKETAEAYIGENVTHAIVAVPSYFTSAQGSAVKDAGAIAGLDILRVINEPTAAALAYGLGDRVDEIYCLAYDLGGTTFDVTLTFIDEGIFDTLANTTDTRFGGEYFNNRVTRCLVNSYKEKTGVDVGENLRFLSVLGQEVEKAKRILSSQLSAHIELKPFQYGYGFNETLTRAKFEELNIDLFHRTIKSIEQILKDANVTKEKIDEIILVGGSTHVVQLTVWSEQASSEFVGTSAESGVKER